MISANGGLPAHRYTPQVTPRWPRGSEPASPGSPWLAHGSPLDGDWFPNLTGLLLGTFGLPSHPMSCSPSPHTFTGPIPASRGFPIPWGRCVAPAPIPSLIPCLYPTGPPATPWRGPTGSSSIRGPLHALCMGSPIHSASSAHSAHSPPHIPVRVVWPLFPSRVTFGPPMFWHENTAGPRGCGLAGTPLHVPPLGLGGQLCSVFCMLAPPAVLPSLTSSCIPPMAHCASDVYPSPLMAEAPSFCCSPHTWLGRIAVCVICALGHARWAAHVFHLCLGQKNTARVVFVFFCCAAVT